MFSALVMATMSSMVMAQESPLCADLEERIVTLFPNTLEEASCRCTGPDNDDTLTYNCDFGRVCITAGDDDEGTVGEPFSGTVTTSVVLDDVTASSFSKLYILEICFDYDDNELYGGKKVCHESRPEPLGGLGSCSITVGGKQCELCTFCNSRDEGFNLLSAFDCSNAGGEEARTCVADNAGSEDTVVRFLANPQYSTECERTSSSAGLDVVEHLRSMALVMGMIVSFLFA